MGDDKIFYRLPSWLSHKESACQAGDTVQSLGREDPLEEEMATHFTILAWEIQWRVWARVPRPAVHGVAEDFDSTWRPSNKEQKQQQ